MGSPLLSLHNIELKEKEQTILKEISLDVFPGDFMIVLGGNGSGKSSLIKIINGLMEPTAGTLCLKGRSLRHVPTYRRSRSIVTLTQDLTLSTFSGLTVLENCLLAIQRCQRVSCALPTRNDRKIIQAYVAQYHPRLAEKLDEPLFHLSGGERQILAFAMSLWYPPQLLLLDEHTSALDPSMAEHIMTLTTQMVSLKKITTIAVTHQLEDALRYGNRLVALRQGRLILNLHNKSQLTRDDLLKIYTDYTISEN